MTSARIIRDHDRPDRDLYVFDAATLALEQVVEGVGTLLYGVEARGDRVWITHTDARNHLEGLAALDNRMFENRLAALDCAGGCGAPQIADLDANPFGVPVPTPYGVRSSTDGETLVVSVAGSDGLPGLAGDPGKDIPGLVTLDRDGNVLGHVQTGAIPQGVALASDEQGAAKTAYVLRHPKAQLTSRSAAARLASRLNAISASLSTAVGWFPTSTPCWASSTRKTASGALGSSFNSADRTATSAIPCPPCNDFTIWPAVRDADASLR